MESMCVIRKAMPKVKKSTQKVEANKALISANKVELLRLQHELESCHTASCHAERQADNIATFV
jgi:hypothetical protein